MKRLALYLLLPLFAACSTGPFLYPESTVGEHALLVRTCPGAKPSMRYKTASKALDWVHLLVYAPLPGMPTKPDSHLSTDTELRMYVYLYTPPYMRNLQTPEQRKIAEETPPPALWISAASPEATVQLANGKSYTVTIEHLKTGFDPRETNLDIYSPGTPLGDGEMDDFILTLPDLFLNGEKIPTAPIHFKVREERHMPLLNC
ncbi:hypothetical protein [Pseudomonas gozinkensis]|uniref:hypothetical protein n=1 Tax=Pseudomonas gozinkensis TaxID=2774461 RepID=UPI001787C89E|nr:hypothetical protein [Pseudomonas gozinkensis]